MIDAERDLVSLDELRSVLNASAGPDGPRAHPTQHRSRRGRQVLLVALGVIALVGAGAAIADGLGAFDGIGAAQHPRSGADLLDAKTLEMVQSACPGDTVHASFYKPFCHLVLDSTRLVGHVPSYGNVYVVTVPRGDLCTLFGSGGSCGPPLSESQPITFGTFNRSPTTGGTFIASGLAIDGVAAVSFTIGGKAVEAPVENNVWMYAEPNSHAVLARCVLAHLDDGTTVNPFPKQPCP
jgi:hypothetical protein